jgi:uncharacterized iron-regulated membrane protein
LRNEQKQYVARLLERASVQALPRWLGAGGRHGIGHVEPGIGADPAGNRPSGGMTTANRALRRRWWLRLHRWLGLTLGGVLLVCALTGTLLVAAAPLDRALHPELFTVPGPGTGALAPLLQPLRAEFGAYAALRLRPPRQPGESLQVLVSGPWRGTVYLDAATGRELGRRGRDEGFFNLLFELHSRLLLEQDTGRAVLALVALACVAMLLTGAVLWWPARWRHAWTVKTRHGLTRALFDLHRVAGATLGLLVLVAVATGAYMAWKPLSGWVTAWAGQEPLRPPKVVPAPAGAATLDLDAAVARAQTLFPGSELGFVQLPPGLAPVRVRLRLPDDPHPNGQTSVWLHPQTGQVLAAQAWSRLDAGAKAYSFIYPLHTGELGGPATLAATTVAGLALSGYGLSGLWLWWRRRRGLR